MQARASQDQHLENIALIWTAGFATGANSQGATLDSLDNEGILKYLDTFCSTNKDSNIARALTILVGPLQPRASVN
jgi:hypothetical protein